MKKRKLTVLVMENDPILGQKPTTKEVEVMDWIEKKPVRTTRVKNYYLSRAQSVKGKRNTRHK